MERAGIDIIAGRFRHARVRAGGAQQQQAAQESLVSATRASARRRDAGCNHLGHGARISVVRMVRAGARAVATPADDDDRYRCGAPRRAWVRDPR
jgi:hypothetical protein